MVHSESESSKSKVISEKIENTALYQQKNKKKTKKKKTKKKTEKEKHLFRYLHILYSLRIISTRGNFFQENYNTIIFYKK